MNEMLQAWMVQEWEVFGSRPFSLVDSIPTLEDGCDQQNQDRSRTKTIDFLSGKSFKGLPCVGKLQRREKQYDMGS